MMLYFNAGTRAKSEPKSNGSELMAENCPKKPENTKAVLKYVILGYMKAVFIFAKPHIMKMRKVAKLLPMLKFCEIEKKIVKTMLCSKFSATFPSYDLTNSSDVFTNLFHEFFFYEFYLQSHTL